MPDLQQGAGEGGQIVKTGIVLLVYLSLLDVLSTGAGLSAGLPEGNGLALTVIGAGGMAGCGSTRQC